MLSFDKVLKIADISSRLFYFKLMFLLELRLFCNSCAQSQNVNFSIAVSRMLFCMLFCVYCRGEIPN